MNSPSYPLPKSKMTQDAFYDRPEKLNLYIWRLVASLIGVFVIRSSSRVGIMKNHCSSLNKGQDLF